MNYNIPPERNIGDGWCDPGLGRPCGPPSEIANENLEKSSGGGAGYFAITKKQCVGDAYFDPLKDHPTYNYKRGGATCRVGCPQTRDFDWENYVLQRFEMPSTGSHILKIVPSNFSTKNCSNKISTMNQQSNVLYTSTCYRNIGDKEYNENLNNRKYEKKCSSYEMNVNPQGNAFSSNYKCCSPKISGPFLLETTRKKAIVSAGTGTIVEKIYDAPNDNEIYTNRPDLNIFNENLKYNLENRIHCDCKEIYCGSVAPPTTTTVAPTTTTTTATPTTIPPTTTQPPSGICICYNSPGCTGLGNDIGALCANDADCSVLCGGATYGCCR